MSTGNTADNNFTGMLTRLKRVWQTGLFIRDLIQLVSWIIVILTAYSILDFFLAMESTTRIALDIAIAAGLVLFVLIWGLRTGMLTKRDMAKRADELLKSPRHTILSALELGAFLEKNPSNAEGLTGFLVGRSIADSAGELSGLRFRDHFPFHEIGVQCKFLVLALVAAAIAMGLNITASYVIVSRIILPWQDIPPYSRYVFSVKPANPVVIYGGDAEIAVEITGQPVKSQVWFISRYQGKSHRTACFQESTVRYAQRLEKVVSPVEFCFAVGKARTTWQKVNVRLQPAIALASVTITPPPYARLPKRQFFVGNENLAGLKESKVDLSLTSNRPLLDGVLTIHPRSGLGGDEVVRGARATSANTVAFQWNMKEPADIEVVIRDLQGTKNREPLKMEQKIVPDAPPTAAITEPSGMALATPHSLVPLRGYADDDLGLRSVELVRTVSGYRDRIKPLGPDQPNSRLEFESTLDLNKLGVEPGEVLEFYVEASDLNPAMVGAAASDIVRLQIISEADYAVMLRARTTADQLMKRYRLVESSMAQLKQTLQDLKKAAAAGNAGEIAKALDKAKETDRAISDLFDKMSKDFSIYDVEKSLSPVLADIAQTTRDDFAELNQAKPSDKELAAMAQRMLDKLGEPERKVAAEVAKAGEVERVAALIECAMRFKTIMAQQRDLVRRLTRYELESGSKDLPLLASLGRKQQEIRDDLDAFMKDTPVRAAALPDKYQALKSSAVEFVNLIGKYEIPEFMKKAIVAAENQQGEPTYRNAKLALERLEQLLKECGGSDDGKGDPGTAFGRLCKGSGPGDWPDDLKSTLEEMLAAMCMRMGTGAYGQGTGMLGGGTDGGDVSDGYWAGGNSPLNIAVFGPQRTDYVNGKAGGSGQSSDASCNVGVRVESGASENMSVRERSGVKSESMPLENVPEKYREAVKRYFSGKESP